MNKKLFAFDMDGTILNSKNQVLTETVDAIKLLKNNGHIAVIATGRPLLDAYRDTKNVIEFIDFIVCNNGAYIVDIKTKEIIRQGEVPSNIVNKIAELSKTENAYFTIHGDERAKRAKRVIPASSNSEEEQEFKKFIKDLKPIDEVLKWSKTQHVSQVSLLHTEEKIKRIAESLKDLHDKVSIHISNNIYLDINPIGISKFEGLKTISELLNISLKDMISFGDSGNDLQMLEGTGLGIAMDNGNDDAKKIADEVIGTNDSNAIAKKIIELIS